MNRDDDLIDLGQASVETQGPGQIEGDDSVGLQAFGLSDE